MKKTLLATAVAAAMIPGLAAADVQIFGAVQAEAGNLDVDAPGANLDTNISGGASGAINGVGKNAIGVKGTENLGNGTSLYFSWAGTYSTFNGGATLPALGRYAGIKGDGWHVQAGRMQLAFSNSMDPFDGTGLQADAIGGTSQLNEGFANDLVEFGFASGSLSGKFQTKFEDGSGKRNTFVNNAARTATGPVDSGSWSARLDYDAGAFSVGIAHVDLSYEATVGVNDGDLDATKIYGTYKANGLTLNAMYEDLDASNGARTAGAVTHPDGGTVVADNIAAVAGLTNAATSLGLAAAARTGNGSGYDSFILSGTYAMTDNTLLLFRYTDSELEDIGGLANVDVDIDGWALGVAHVLSKRTLLYTGYMDNTFDVDTVGDVDVDAWAVGMVHSF